MVCEICPTCNKKNFTKCSKCNLPICNLSFGLDGICDGKNHNYSKCCSLHNCEINYDLIDDTWYIENNYHYKWIFISNTEIFYSFYNSDNNEFILVKTNQDNTVFEIKYNLSKRKNSISFRDYDIGINFNSNFENVLISVDIKKSKLNFDKITEHYNCGCEECSETYNVDGLHLIYSKEQEKFILDNVSHI